MLGFKQQGFSLIELMVAMALGTFIIGGLLSVFISATRSYTTQQALVEVQSKGRFTIEKLRDDIQLAGLGLGDSETPVRLVPQGGVSDCDSSTSAVLEIYFNENDVAINSMRCYHLNASNLIRNDTVVGTAALVGNNITMTTQVNQINYTFAVDTNADGSVDLVAGNIYQTEATLTAAGTPDWNDVIAVRIELIVSSNTQRVLDSAQRLTNPFDKNPAVHFDATGYSTSDTADDDLSLHQAYTALVSLRSRIE